MPSLGASSSPRGPIGAGTRPEEEEPRLLLGDCVTRQQFEDSLVHIVRLGFIIKKNRHPWCKERARERETHTHTHTHTHTQTDTKEEE